MIDFLKNNLGTILISLGLIIIVIYIINYLRKTKGSCGSCSGKGTCSACASKQKK